MLILNDLDENFRRSIFDIFPEDSKFFSKDKDPIKSCIGCFGCWIKTPATCVINDISREISIEMMKSETLLIITELTYGCYSPYIKNVLDRSIPNILPFFKKINNEIHHAPRYTKYPKIIGIGYGEDITTEEEVTFKKLVKANAINFQTDQFAIYIIKDLSDLKSVITNIVRSDLSE